MADNQKGWAEISRKYRIYIKVERALSDNTVESYMRDLRDFAKFIVEQYDLPPKRVERAMIENYLALLFDREIRPTSQARVLSSIKAFFGYLQLSEVIDISPAEFISSPRFGRHIPDVLSIEEVDLIINSIDDSTQKGLRDRAILETLYSCGVRVSEVVTLRLCDLFFGEGYIRVTGKGDKERLVPISAPLKTKISAYLEYRQGVKSNEESLFLSNRGKPLTRVMIFTIIKNATRLSGVNKRVSPHTFRHSFATHLLNGGASIRQVQEMLGHENISTTEIYTHLELDSIRETVEDYLPI